jgi:hypothetical protein
MGGPRLTPPEIEKGNRENKRYSTLFQRIKNFSVIRKLKHF